MRARGRGYGRGSGKRALDLLLALPALFVLSPLMALLALAVLLGSGPPTLFRHERVGRDGRTFRLLKFRSMRAGGPPGPPITAGDDPRITPVGRFLRRTKLDELPQLFNILAGDMSVVGPRPEVPHYVVRYDATQREVLAVRPGLTDPAALAYRHEEDLLGAVPPPGREEFYLREIMPRKLALSLEYVRTAGPAADLALILRTIVTVLAGRRA